MVFRPDRADPGHVQGAVTSRRRRSVLLTLRALNGICESARIGGFGACTLTREGRTYACSFEQAADGIDIHPVKASRRICIVRNSLASP